MSLKSFNELPGPWGFPIVGSLFSLSRDQGEVLSGWADEYYGPVFKVKLGSHEIVTLQGYRAIHEALVEKSTTFSGRIDAEIISAFNGDKGLFFTDVSSCWRFWHKFAVQSLGATWKTSFVEIIKEAESFKDHLGRYLDAPKSIEEITSLSMMNNVLQTCFSKKYDLNDVKAKELYDAVYKTASNPNFAKLFFFPQLKNLSSKKGFLNEAKERRNKKMQLIKELIKERRANFNQSSIDIVVHSLQNNLGSDLESDDHLASFISDMMFGGSVTTSSQFLWVLLFLLKNPDCLKKVQREIRLVLSGEKLSEDKLRNLHYTAAAIEETYRLRPIAPTSSLHKTTAPTSVSGYQIPAHTPVLINLWSVHMDKSTWGPDPETFRPERHLDRNGKFVKSGHVMPFSIGSRRCVGERIAHTEIVAYLSSILLNYDVKLANESVDVDFRPVPGNISKPKPFKIVLESPKQTSESVLVNASKESHVTVYSDASTLLPKRKNFLESKTIFAILFLVILLLFFGNISLSVLR